VPDIELGSDWIVGFPGESDADFRASVDFLEEIGTVQNFVFQYSPRPGTRAAELEDDVPLEVKKTRNQELLQVAERVAVRRHREHIGRELEVFVEEGSRPDRPMVRGRSVQGLPVVLQGTDDLVGRTVVARIEQASAFGLWGTALVPAAVPQDA
jgi:tRNA-2-methylthio-N6-dimethylallyladenosine synthase